MSELHVGIIAEGKTDIYIIRKMLEHILKDSAFVCTSISPTEEELLGQQKKESGFGWRSVYYMCKELDERLALQQETGIHFDLLVIHLDGDVSQSTYDEARIDDIPNPEELPCYDDDETVVDNCSRLRNILLSWINSDDIDTDIACCIPYINSDIWVAYIFYSRHRKALKETMTLHELNNFLLRQPSKARLVRNRDGKIKKLTPMYKKACNELSEHIFLEMKARFDQVRIFCEDVEEKL